jgi:hypothetical protein
VQNIITELKPAVVAIETDREYLMKFAGKAHVLLGRIVGLGDSSMSNDSEQPQQQQQQEPPQISHQYEILSTSSPSSKPSSSLSSFSSSSKVSSESPSRTPPLQHPYLSSQDLSRLALFGFTPSQLLQPSDLFHGLEVASAISAARLTQSHIKSIDLPIPHIRQPPTFHISQFLTDIRTRYKLPIPPDQSDGSKTAGTWMHKMEDELDSQRKLSPLGKLIMKSLIRAFVGSEHKIETDALTIEEQRMYTRIWTLFNPIAKYYIMDIRNAIMVDHIRKLVAALSNENRKNERIVVVVGKSHVFGMGHLWNAFVANQKLNNTVTRTTTNTTTNSQRRSTPSSIFIKTPSTLESICDPFPDPEAFEKNARAEQKEMDSYLLSHATLRRQSLEMEQRSGISQIVTVGASAPKHKLKATVVNGSAGRPSIPPPAFNVIEQQQQQQQRTSSHVIRDEGSHDVGLGYTPKQQESGVAQDNEFKETVNNVVEKEEVEVDEFLDVRKKVRRELKYVD